ncbi:unnamed protein product [Polarella glacialis]|uniref:Uncharacterized protein n=1 Tax=Polarella glacialis TaxID=89957 RepID=A0A813JAS4_POLGL|nr:unnamed protein product [Polarella glacialis]
MGRTTCRARRPLLPILVALGMVWVCAGMAADQLFVSLPVSRMSRPRASLLGSTRQSQRRIAAGQAGLAGGKDSGDVKEVVQPQRSKLVQGWGVFGVCAYLGYGVQKVVPIVLDGLGSIDSWWQWGLLAANLLFFAYVEGYKGFQLGFSPRVVARSWAVSEETEQAPVWHKLLAPAFCIGYFHGTKKRVITSWAVTTGIFLVVIGVKQLANPYRAIIDAGVIVGLIWGIVSIIVLYVQSLQNDRPPKFDPALPEDTPYTPPPSIDTPTA